MRVLKFGGAALRDGPAVRHAARLVAAFGGDEPLVVVSAHAGVTAQLERAVEAALEGRLEWDPLRIRHRTLLRQLELPGELLDRHLTELRGVLEALRTDRRADERFRDFVLSFGERMSARVFAAALRAEGIEATPLDAPDLGLVKANGRLPAPEEAPPRLLAALREARGVPVLTGFLALDAEGHLTTLGRNGTDLTAAWFGAALGAEEVQLWKRVPGLMTADPAVVPDARHLAALSWSHADELARHGSGVLHPGSVEPVRRAGTVVHVRNLEDADGPGTRIGGDGPVPRGVVAIAHRTSVARLVLPLEADRGRSHRLAELFGALAVAGVEPTFGALGPGGVDLLLSEDRWLQRAVAARFPAGELRGGLASVALVGSELDGDAAVGAAVAEAEAAGACEVRGELLDGAPTAARVLVLPRDGLEELVVRLHARLFGPRGGTAAGARLS